MVDPWLLGCLEVINDGQCFIFSWWFLFLKLDCQTTQSYFSEVERLVWIVEGGEFSGAAVQVDETRAESRQEAEAVIN